MTAQQGEGRVVQHIGYKRVSTLDQNTERQLDGKRFDAEFEDKASGKDTNRPKLQEMISYVRDGDTVHVHSIDRLARDTSDLLRLVKELNGKGVTVRFEKENLTFGGDEDAMGKLMMTMLAAFADFERAMIRERQREGIALAKQRGVYSKKRTKKLTLEQITKLRARADAGEKKAVIARDFGISRETLYQYLKAEPIAA
jgi:DNA invertase Pin-like site-specific DNA recombinase